MQSISVAVIVSSVSLAAQTNLVPNPGFESLLQIPCNCQQEGDMERNVVAWHQGAQSTADILTLDADSSCYAHPTSKKGYRHGYELPHSGKAMAMIMTTANEYNWREYVGTTLTQPLQAGKRYYAEAYVSLAEGSGLASNNIGFLFGTGNYAERDGYMITADPQVNWQQVITNVNGWTKISGYFVATEAYTTVMIGNFLPREQTTFKCTPVITGNISRSPNLCAYYIDDILIRPAGDLMVTGDSVVNVGAIASLVAKGGQSYTWVDTRQPNSVLGTSPELKIAVTKRTTFRVTSGDDALEITVNVRKTTLAYAETLRGRKVRKGRTVVVHHEEITVSVHDKNDVDGDSVTIYYGDSLVAEHVALTKKKQSFTIKVDKNSPKQLILYAENLGSVPPNTAALTIKDGKESTDIVLGSDYKFCDSVMLMYKEED